MKYLLLALYVISYSSGFANAALTFVAYRRTGRVALLHYLLLLGAFFLFLLLSNVGFLLNVFFRVEDFQERFGYLAAASAIFSSFNVAGSYFIHSAPDLGFAGGRKRLFLVISLLPLLILAIEGIRLVEGTADARAYKPELQAISLLTAVLVVYSTILFALKIRSAVDEFLRKLMRLVVVLNAVFVPFTFAELLLNFDPANRLKPFSAENLYYFLGNLVCSWFLLSSYFPAHARLDSRSEGPSLIRAAGISDREWEIILLVGAGLSNKEISAKLGIEPSTVKNHLYRIYKKAGVASRVGLLRFLQARGEPALFRGQTAD
jgi:DNA-binding CsgD family transcriptional regulator